MIRPYLIICCFFLVMVFSCTEPYYHKAESYTEALVVEGMVTTKPGPYTVKLMKTVSLNSDDMKFETNAVVAISDDEGNIETLTEVNPGIYKTSPDGLQGKPGNTYVLTIHTEEGDKYESEPVKLREGPDIDSVSTSVGQRVSYESLEDTLKGININVTSNEWNSEKDYFLRWDYEETWEVEPNYYPIDTVHEKNTTPCWNVTYCTDVIIENTAAFNINKIEEKPVIFLDQFSPKPYRGYSVLIKQYTMNESVYEFFRMIKENNEDNGDIFDNVPYNAVSNIECCNDPDKKVFGYFDAADVDEVRKYYKQPIEGIWFHDAINEDCKPTYLPLEQFENLDISDPVYVIDIIPGSGERSTRVAYFKQRSCVDCSVYATTTKKPSFWDYE